MWQLGTHKQKSDSVSISKLEIINYCVKNQLVNVQTVLSLQSGLRSIRQRIPELMASGKSQRKPEKILRMKFELKKGVKILQKIRIVFHVVLAFLRGTCQYQRLSLLHCSASSFHNQGAEKVQEHALPSACRRTTVSLRLKTQIRRHKR